MTNPASEPTSTLQLELSGLLRQWLPEQRWYAGKGRAISELVVTAASRAPSAPEVIHIIVGVQLDAMHWQTYQVPVSVYRDERPGLRVIGQLADGRWVHDALSDQEAVPALLVASGAPAEVDPELTNRPDGTPDSEPAPTLQAVVDPSTYLGHGARPLGVEQSNTSLVLGEVALVKFFRQLVPGINPDVDVHAALGVAQCPHVGRILGWVNAGWRDPRDGHWITGHTAMVQQLLAPAVEGRDLALERLAAGESFAEEALELGRATGVVHRDLRRVLPTHVLSEPEVAELVDRLRWRLDQAAAVVEDLAPLLPALHARLDAIGDVTEPIEVQRVHGDLHLQQVMRAGDGWKLLDFEGEPGSEITERVAPDHPLRDVAGMLRSFAYAAAQGGAGRDPGQVAAWLEECQASFLRGYAEGAADPRGEGGLRGHAGSAPAVAARADEVLRTGYLVDKAAYEAVYEKRNRPDWLPIPMSALVDLANSDEPGSAH